MSLHDLLVAPFSYEFMRRGLLSASLLGIGGGLLGCVLVLRRMALMGDALSHSLLPGIAVAWLLFGTSTTALFFGGLVAGLLTALGSAVISRLTRVKEDAAFGSLFVLFFALGVALISRLPTRVNLADFLFGNVLGVSPGDLRLAAAVSGATVVLFALFYRSILLETFDPVFHRATGGWGGWIHAGFLTLTVLNLVAAMQTMGVVLALGLFLPARRERLPMVRPVSLDASRVRRDRPLRLGARHPAELPCGSRERRSHRDLPRRGVPRLGAPKPAVRGARRDEAGPRAPRGAKTRGAAVLLMALACLRLGAEEPLRVATLSSVLTEVAREVGGDRVAVTGLVPAGADPHTFSPSPRDIRSMVDADVVLASGMNIEAYLGRLIASDIPQGRVLAVGDRLPSALQTFGPSGAPEKDPHWWNSIGNVARASAIVAAEFGRLRPALRRAFDARAAAYAARLAVLGRWAEGEMRRVPPGRRVLVTSHDAFGYFARDYGFTVLSVNGVSTEGEADARRVAALVDEIRRDRIPAVFVESSTNPRLVENLVQETGVSLGGTLYADGLGPPGSGAETYDALFRHNVSAIVRALAPSAASRCPWGN